MYAVNVHFDWTKPTDKPVTKADALWAKKEALEATLKSVMDEIGGLQLTPCGLSCSGCGEYFESEYDFAAHFTIKRQDLIADRLNLGDCPKSGNRR